MLNITQHSSCIDELKINNTDYDNIVTNHNGEEHLVWARDRNAYFQGWYINPNNNNINNFCNVKKFGYYDDSGDPDVLGEYVEDYAIEANEYIASGMNKTIDFSNLQKNFPDGKQFKINFEMLRSNKIEDLTKKVYIPFSCIGKDQNNNDIQLTGEFPVCIGMDFQNNFAYYRDNVNVYFLKKEFNSFSEIRDIGYEIYRTTIDNDNTEGEERLIRFYVTNLVRHDNPNNQGTFLFLFEENESLPTYLQVPLRVGKLIKAKNPNLYFQDGNFTNFTPDFRPLWRIISPKMEIYDDNGFKMELDYIEPTNVNGNAHAYHFIQTK